MSAVLNDTPTAEISTLSLHDALPIFVREREVQQHQVLGDREVLHLPHLVDHCVVVAGLHGHRSEEHTSELQSRLHLVCRLLLEKKKTQKDAERIYEQVRADSTH